MICLLFISLLYTPYILTVKIFLYLHNPTKNLSQQMTYFCSSQVQGVQDKFFFLQMAFCPQTPRISSFLFLQSNSIKKPYLMQDPGEISCDRESWACVQNGMLEMQSHEKGFYRIKVRYDIEVRIMWLQ